MAKPTLDDVKTATEQDEKFWVGRNARMERHEGLFHLVEKKADKSIESEGQLTITLNDPKVLIEKIAGMISRRKYRIEIYPKEDNLGDAAQAEENACRKVDEEWDRQHSEGLGNYRAFDYIQCLLRRGWVTRRIMLDPENPETFCSETLFDPYTVYPCVANKKIVRVSHVYKASVAEVLAEFPNLKEKFDGRDLHDLVDVKGYYENKEPYWHAVIVDGDFGKEPTALKYWAWVLQTAKGDFSIGVFNEGTEHIGQGFLDAIEGIIDKLNKFATIIANIAAKIENPSRVQYVDVDGKQHDIDLRPGADNYMLFGREKLELVNVGNDINKVVPILDILNDREQKGSVPSVI